MSYERRNSTGSTAKAPPAAGRRAHGGNAPRLAPAEHRKVHRSADNHAAAELAQLSFAHPYIATAPTGNQPSREGLITRRPRTGRNQLVRSTALPSDDGRVARRKHQK